VEDAQADTPSGPSAEDFVWDEEESALRRYGVHGDHFDLTLNADPIL
jgi:hypothetical protein